MSALFILGKISDGNKLWESAVLIFWEKFEERNILQKFWGKIF